METTVLYSAPIVTVDQRKWKLPYYIVSHELQYITPIGTLLFTHNPVGLRTYGEKRGKRQPANVEYEAALRLKSLNKAGLLLRNLH